MLKSYSAPQAGPKVLESILMRSISFQHKNAGNTGDERVVVIRRLCKSIITKAKKSLYLDLEGLFTRQGGGSRTGGSGSGTNVYRVEDFTALDEHPPHSQL